MRSSTCNQVRREERVSEARSFGGDTGAWAAATACRHAAAALPRAVTALRQIRCESESESESALAMPAALLRSRCRRRRWGRGRGRRDLPASPGVVACSISCSLSRPLGRLFWGEGLAPRSLILASRLARRVPALAVARASHGALIARPLGCAIPRRLALSLPSSYHTTARVSTGGGRGRRRRGRGEGGATWGQLEQSERQGEREREGRRCDRGASAL